MPAALIHSQFGRAQSFDHQGMMGRFGGRFVLATLVPALEELGRAVVNVACDEPVPIGRRVACFVTTRRCTKHVNVLESIPATNEFVSYARLFRSDAK